MAYGDKWSCLGEGAAHVAEVEVVEVVSGSWLSSHRAIHRCRACGQLYFYHYHETSDWSGGGDYSSETRSWQVLAADEAEAVRLDPNYQPRSDALHREESPWRSDG